MTQDQTNERVFSQWQRLNRTRNEVYLRFQRFTARYHQGSWWRGITIEIVNGIGIVSAQFE